jgi:hypothetical protein
MESVDPNMIYKISNLLIQTIFSSNIKYKTKKSLMYPLKVILEFDLCKFCNFRGLSCEKYHVTNVCETLIKRGNFDIFSYLLKFL